jgi:prepilin-type N-terminal cleavage/methylation domain-containing protein
MNDKRRGFTLVELLVVIAIIGILVALLLPAIQAAREAGRRSACSNNLKQFGLSLQEFHDIYNTYPPGMTDDDTNNFGWGAYILPFMEQKPLWDQIDTVFRNSVPNGTWPRPIPILRSGPHPGDQTLPTPVPANIDSWANVGSGDQPWRNDAPLQRPYTQVELREFMCPSSAFPKRDDDQYGTSTYAGNVGTEVIAFSSFACGNAPHRDAQTGVLLHDGNNTVSRLVGMQDVIDGTANVFLVGEIGPSANVHARNVGNGNYPVWSGGNNDAGCDARFMGSTLRFCGPNFYLNRGWAALLITPPPASPDYSDLCFGSYHPAGAQFVMCDGSVQFIKKNIKTNIYHFLAARDDGNPTNSQ